MLPLGKNYIQVKNYVAMTGNYYCVAPGYPIWRNKDLVVSRMCNDVSSRHNRSKFHNTQNIEIKISGILGD